MKPLLEKEIQSAILDYLHYRKIFAWKTGSGAFRVGDRFVRMGQVGVADIVGILPNGQFFACEVKSKRGKLTPLQEEFIATIKRNKGVAIVARCLDDVINTLK